MHVTLALVPLLAVLIGICVQNPIGAMRHGRLPSRWAG
jgi:hypothetical protein